MKLDLESKDTKNIVRNHELVRFEVFGLCLENMTFLKGKKEPTLFFTTHYATGHTFSLATKAMTQFHFADKKTFLNSPYLMCRLSPSLYFLPSEQ